MVQKNIKKTTRKSTKKRWKNDAKMRSLLEPTFRPLWAPLGPLLGGSWASLGRPWASKMGSKRVTVLEIRVSFIPSCFFCRFFRLRSASGSLLGRILAPSWCHLGPSWDDLSRFLVDFLGFSVNVLWGPQWMDNWTDKKLSQSSLNSPARRNARSDWINISIFQFPNCRLKEIPFSSGHETKGFGFGYCY